MYTCGLYSRYFQKIWGKEQNTHEASPSRPLNQSIIVAARDPVLRTNVDPHNHHSESLHQSNHAIQHDNSSSANPSQFHVHRKLRGKQVHLESKGQRPPIDRQLPDYGPRDFSTPASRTGLRPTRSSWVRFWLRPNNGPQKPEIHHCAAALRKERLPAISIRPIRPSPPRKTPRKTPRIPCRVWEGAVQHRRNTKITADREIEQIGDGRRKEGGSF